MNDWVPIAKNASIFLPVGYRPYTQVEALFRIQLDHDDCRRVSVAQYAREWKWSRSKVNRFLERLGITIDRAGRKDGILVYTGVADNRSPVLFVKKYSCHNGNPGAAGKEQEKSRKKAAGCKGQQHDALQREQAKDNTRANKKKQKKTFSPKIIALVNRFYQRVAKNGGKKKYTPREIERAADTIDKLIRIDGYKFEEVEKALFWALDDDFWSAQVRSLASLRKRRLGADDDTKFTKVFNKYSTSSPDALLSAGKIMVNGKLYNVV